MKTYKSQMTLACTVENTKTKKNKEQTNISLITNCAINLYYVFNIGELIKIGLRGSWKAFTKSKWKSRHLAVVVINLNPSKKSFYDD